MSAGQQFTVLWGVRPGVLASQDDGRSQYHAVVVRVDLDFHLRLALEPQRSADFGGQGQASRLAHGTVTVLILAVYHIGNMAERREPTDTGPSPACSHMSFLGHSVIGRQVAL